MVKAPATCGELFQGTLDDVPCLVSCPIDMWTSADVELHEEPGWTAPAACPKARQALQAGLDMLGRSRQGGALQITSPIPRGRGYGSSTADIIAALGALGTALGEPFAPPAVAQLAVAVEPSDSTMFPDLALFDHRRGTRYDDLGAAPPLAVIVIDPGGVVDTVAYNARDHTSALQRIAGAHREAFAMLCDGLRRRDMYAIGAAATMSAQLHQCILHNPLLETALGIARATGALGVCRAHSGTILGLLLDPANSDPPAVARYVAEHLGDGVTVLQHRLVGGGVRCADTTMRRTS